MLFTLYNLSFLPTIKYHVFECVPFPVEKKMFFSFIIFNFFLEVHIKIHVLRKCIPNGKISEKSG